MAAVAVGGLDEDVVGLADRLRVGEDRGRVAADVAGEDQAPARRLPELELDGGRAEDVARAPERRLDAGQETGGLS